jgi:hypothetical protein
MSAAAPLASGLANSPASGGGFDQPQVAITIGLEWRLPPARAKKLEKKGYIRRDSYATPDGSTMPAVYFDGLVTKLASLAKSDAALSVRLMRSAMPVEVSGGEDIPF